MKKIITTLVFTFLCLQADAATYQLTNNALANNAQMVIIESTQSYIPNDPKNDDYQTYLAWLATSNTPDPAPTITQPTITQPSISGCNATTINIQNSNSTIMAVFNSGISGICTVTMMPGNQLTAAHGWNCTSSDLTTPKNIITQILPFSTTGATISGTTVSGDLLNFTCVPF